MNKLFSVANLIAVAQKFAIIYGPENVVPNPDSNKL